MYQLRTDDNLCRRGCPLTSQSIDYGLDFPPSGRRCPDAIVRKLTSKYTIKSNFQACYLNYLRSSYYQYGKIRILLKVLVRTWCNLFERNYNKQHKNEAHFLENL